MASRMVQSRCIASFGRKMSLTNHANVVALHRSLASWNTLHHNTTTRASSTNSSFLREGKGPIRNKVLRELGIMTDRIPHQPLRYRRRPARAAGVVETLRPATSTIRVKSVHAAQTLDVVSILSKVFGVSSPMPPVRHMLGKSSVIVQLSPPPSDEEAQPRYVAVYRYGSVVFFNMSPLDTAKLLEAIKKHG